MKEKVNCDLFTMNRTIAFGGIDVTGNVYIGEHSYIIGKLETEGKVYVMHDSKVRTIQTTDEVIVEENTWGGNIEARCVYLGNHVHAGKINTGGNVELGNQCNTRDIKAGGDVKIGDYAYVSSVEAGGNVEIGKEAHIGYIKAKGSVIIGEYADMGYVKAEGDVTVAQYGNMISVEGDNVSIDSNAIMVYAEGTNVVLGEDCELWDVIEKEKE